MKSLEAQINYFQIYCSNLCYLRLMLGVDKPARKLGSLCYRRVSSNTLDQYTVAANYSVPVKSCLILNRHSTDTCSALEQHSINLANNMLINSRLRCRPIHWSTHDPEALPYKLSPWCTVHANKNVVLFPDYPPPEKQLVNFCRV